MNRAALLEILNRPGSSWRPAGLALADFPERPAVPAREDPRARLWTLLDLRAAQDDATEAEANIKALYEDIMDIFRDNPRDADGWFRDWRTAHPTARLA